MIFLFDHLIGADEKCEWEGMAERLGSLHVDDQLPFATSATANCVAVILKVPFARWNLFCPHPLR